MEPGVAYTWADALGPAALVTALLYVPGWAMAGAVGLRGVARAGATAPLGLLVLLGVAQAADSLGVVWSAAVGATALVVVCVGLTGVSVWRRRDADCTSSVGLGGFAAGVSVALVLTIWRVRDAVGSPDLLPQVPDVQFHLKAVQHLVQAHSASPMRSDEVFFYVSAQYPGGFHSLAATVAAWTGSNALIASHATLLVCAALVWPVGVVGLVHELVSTSRWVLGASGMLAASCVFGPVALLGAGGPWSNLVSAALVPGVLIPIATLVNRREAPERRAVGAMVAASGAAALATAVVHPSALYTLAVLVAALPPTTVLTWGRGWACVYVAVLGVMVVAWTVVRNPILLATPISPDPSTRRAILVLLKNGDVPLWSGGVVIALTVLGAAIGFRTSGPWRGVALAWAVASALAVSLQFSDQLDVQYVTWPWFSAFSRMATTVSLTVVLVASIAIARLERAVRQRTRAIRTGVVAATTTVLVVVGVAAEGAGAESVGYAYHPLREDFGFVTRTEISALQELAQLAGSRATVTLDPLRGGGFLGLYGPRTIPVGPYYGGNRDTDLIDEGLSRALIDPAVCRAIGKLGVTHALVGGDRVETFRDDPTYPGIDAVPTAPGFTLVGESGPYELYSVPSSCSSSY